MSRVIVNKNRLLRALSKLALNVSRDGTFTRSLGNVPQCLSLFVTKYQV